LDAWVKLHTKKIQIPKKRLKKDPHRQLMISGPRCWKEMNIQEDLLPSETKTIFNQYEGNYKRVDREPKWTTSERRSLSPRYQNLFLDHCYTCRNFGHKEINCRIIERNNYARNMNGVNSRYGNVCGFVNISYNPFDPLMD
jgi:hypothetical protein